MISELLVRGNTILSLSMVVPSMGMVPRIIDVWGYDREFCS